MDGEKKVKETPWTEQRLMYKDGNVDVYRYFNWETWKRMTVDERAMWTEASEATPAPISLETIDFNKKLAAKADKIVKPKPEVVEVSVDEIDTSEPLTDAAGQQVGTVKGKLSKIEEARMGLKAELTKRGIRFTHNSKFETLRKKLADADNPE